MVLYQLLRLYSNDHDMKFVQKINTKNSVKKKKKKLHKKNNILIQ